METMRGRAVLLLLGITALAADSAGRQERAGNLPARRRHKCAARLGQAGGLRAGRSTKTAVTTPSSVTAVSPDTTPKPESKRKVEAVLTAAAIAAIIVQASRDQYHAGGRPCACPDDTMRNGSSCGGRSAYSRPGGAAPLCYPGDVTAAMIEFVSAEAGFAMRTGD